VSTPAYLRNPPPPPRLHDPRLLSALDCHPLLPPPNAPDPPLFAWSPQPLDSAELELGFWTLFQLPLLFFSHPLPVFLYSFPLAVVAYLLPLAVSP
jgi:hypothetical protein